MHGGSALARCHAADGKFHVSSCDEDASFTFIETPQWMWYWCAAPPILAYKVAHLLPATLLADIEDIYATYVSPLYRRLAMGASHSVHILMNINFKVIGSALYDYAKLLKKNDEAAEDDRHGVQNVEQPVCVLSRAISWHGISSWKYEGTRPSALRPSEGDSTS